MQVWKDWNSQKIMDLEFPGNKHTYKMCPQIFIKFHAAAKILSSKGQKFSRKIMESNVFCNMHNFTFCPKYLHSFFKKFHAAVWEEWQLHKNRTDWQKYGSTGRLIHPACIIQLRKSTVLPDSWWYPWVYGLDAIVFLTLHNPQSKIPTSQINDIHL